MKALQLLDAPGTTEINVLTGPSGEFQVTAQDAEQLLTAVVSQARLDAMTKVEFHADPQNEQLSVRYFGPGHGNSAQWWGMTPPPIGCYPALLQCAMAYARLDSKLPIHGVIPVAIGRRKADIRFDLSEANRFLLSWDESVLNLDH
jgi:hypothetical protein